MKKSNKLLLGGFLTVVLVIAGIHIALYAKYKNGSYTLVKAYRLEKDVEKDMQHFQNVNVLRIRNVFVANIYFRDSAAVEKGIEDQIQYAQKGDTLFITGHYNSEGQQKDRSELNVTLPYNATIIADSVSHVSLQIQDFFKQKIKIVP